MKHKTAELTGALLDAAVALAEGQEPEIVPYRVSGDFGITFVRDEPVCQIGLAHFEPSTVWAHGGPIIERERIAVVEDGAGFDAFVRAGYYGPDGQVESPVKCGASAGPTYLIAAMRAFVAAKLGEEVELP